MRRLLLKHLTDPTAPVRDRTGAEAQEGLDLLARHVRAADLYWVSPDMAALAVSAGQQLAAVDFGPDVRPSACGLMLFADGVGSIPYPPIEIPVDAVAWGPSPDGLLMSALLDRAAISRAVETAGGELDVGSTPPLVPLKGAVLPVEAEPGPLAALDGDLPTTIVQTVAAAWLLMQQPNLVDRTQSIQPKKSERGANARLGLPDPEVSLVELRRQYTPDDREETGDDGGRRYRHRWVVSGHWKNAWRPSVQQHRKVWVAAHVKGPDGAPFLPTEKVNVWRR
jgi:hypothetical protein